MRKRLPGKNRVRKLLRRLDAAGAPSSSIAELDPQLAQKQKNRLDPEVCKLQAEFLAKAEIELAKCSKFLTADPCWVYFARHRWEARTLFCEDTLRQLVFTAAARFADPAMARLTQRYGKR